MEDRKPGWLVDFMIYVYDIKDNIYQKIKHRKWLEDRKPKVDENAEKMVGKPGWLVDLIIYMI